VRSDRAKIGAHFSTGNLGLATVRTVRSRRTDGSLPAYGRDRDVRRIYGTRTVCTAMLTIQDLL
jgi:hypothetical protein